MTIKFICGCGKHLRARDEMASRRSVCPRCGAPVGVPALRPANPGIAPGPMTPDERRRARKHAPPAGRDKETGDGRQEIAAALRPRPLTPDPCLLSPPQEATAPRPLDAGAVRLVPARKSRRRGGATETHWHAWLLLPPEAWPPLLGLTAALTVLTGGAALALPGLLESRPGPWWLMLLCSLFPLFILAYACGFLQCALNSTAAGETHYLASPGRDLGFVLKSAARWLACFLAGPAMLAAGAAFYWLYCGDPDWADRLIMAELGILAAGYWLLLLTSVSRRGRLTDANPAAVVWLIVRGGDRVAVAALAGGAGAAALVRLLFLGVEELHRNAGAGWLLLAGCWLGGLLAATFLLRLLGAWCHHGPGRLL